MMNTPKYSHFLQRDYSQKMNTKNLFQIPKFSKIVLSTSIDSSLQDTDKILATFEGLERIGGQKSKKTRSRYYLAGFKLQPDQLVGCKITLRNFQMFSFLYNLLYSILPKDRDFGGFPPKSCVTTSVLRSNADFQGNFSFGLKNLFFFHELAPDFELFASIPGIQVNVHVTKLQRKLPRRSRLSRQSIFGQNKKK